MRRIERHVKGALSYPQSRLTPARIRYDGPVNWDRDWFPYAAAVVIAIAVGAGFLFFAMWYGG